MENIKYDPTSGSVLTPNGVGRFVSWDPTRKTVVVEMDCACLVEYPGDYCYIVNDDDDDNDNDNDVVRKEGLF